jgi:hypothetical protein
MLGFSKVQLRDSGGAAFQLLYLRSIWLLWKLLVPELGVKETLSSGSAEAQNLMGVAGSIQAPHVPSAMW